ncbi:MAG: amidohydrolase [Candidatus Longimicrobiales bacterium M2_2A_002]
MTGSRDGRTVLITADRVRGAAGAAGALLVRNGRVAALGDGAELRSVARDVAVLDLPGCTVTPGLTDAHVHLVEWALARRRVDLRATASPLDAARAAARHAEDHDADPGARGWVLGRGWDPSRWADPPHRRMLDDALGERPVALESHDMHSYWASSEALRRAGIDAGTTDPDGGRIERDAGGEPTGVLRDNAIPRLLEAIPAPGRAERRAALHEAQAALHRLGVTGVHTVEPDSLGLLEAVRADDGLRLRVLQHLPLAKLDDAIRLGLRSGFGGPWLRIGGVKMFLDGALGSRTAWLRAPYEDTDDRGLRTLEPDVFRDAVRRGSEAGLAMAVHAIGDAAVTLALEVLAGHADALEGPVPHRIEHAQLMASDLLAGAATEARGAPAARRRVVLSVQPSHLMTDWRAADRHWGARARWAFALRSMESAGYTLALGSDAPVEPPDPRQGLYAAVARRDPDGDPAGGWFPEETLSMDRAWAGFTTGAARAAGDPRQGRLAPGSFADLVAWERDPLAAAPGEIMGLEPMLTMIDGEVVWRP